MLTFSLRHTNQGEVDLGTWEREMSKEKKVGNVVTLFLHIMSVVLSYFPDFHPLARPQPFLHSPVLLNFTVCTPINIISLPKLMLSVLFNTEGD